MVGGTGVTRLPRHRDTRESTHEGVHGKSHSRTVGEPGPCGLCPQRDGLSDSNHEMLGRERADSLC